LAKGRLEASDIAHSSYVVRQAW